MTRMNKFLVTGIVAVMLATAGVAVAQKDKDDEPTSLVKFVVVKDDNGKPVRNAAVIMHPVSTDGRQEKGGMELKTDSDGKCDFDGIPYGKLRVQVLAHGFQTYGDDFNIDKPKFELTVKLKRPQGQFTVYGDPSSQKPDAPPQKPN
jgi:hypothetical protein